GRLRLAGGSRVSALKPEIELSADGIIHHRYEKPAQPPAQAIEPTRPSGVDFARDLFGGRQVEGEISAQPRRQRLILDLQHDLQVQIEAAHVEIGAAEIADIVEHDQLG